jgi:hypothetical protein
MFHDPKEYSQMTQTALIVSSPSHHHTESHISQELDTQEFDMVGRKVKPGVSNSNRVASYGIGDTMPYTMQATMQATMQDTIQCQLHTLLSGNVFWYTPYHTT